MGKTISELFVMLPSTGLKVLLNVEYMGENTTSVCCFILK